jgi:positive regulator of sigma E activity
MNSSVCFEQKGIIESIDNQRIRIRIDRESACGHCSAKGICGLPGLSERTIEADGSPQEYHVGEQVQVMITRSMGNRAIILGYGVPFLLLITVLAVLTEFSLPEWIAGISAIVILVPYFFILYFFRASLRKKIVFAIHKIA